jgi:hypothetical protein
VSCRHILVWSSITVDESGKPIETQKAFYGHLAAEIIDNNYNGGQIDQRINNQRFNRDDLPPAQVINPQTGEIRRGVDLHLTPTNRRQVDHGVVTNQRYPGCCINCGTKTAWCCSGCKDDEEVTKYIFLCEPLANKTCWTDHLLGKHRN